MKIDSFSGQYRFLSNFWMHPVEYSGVEYPSTEHAYQAAKIVDLEARQLIREAKTPGLAKKMGSAVKLRSEWEAIKISVMTKLVRRKFQDAKLANLLLETGNAELIEGNTWGDTFWGVCKGQGQNHLGKILMEIREEIRQNRK